jgi:hypothetical protein
LASDTRCLSTNGASINAFNNESHCGYTDWHLPIDRNPGGYVDAAGGDWGAIGTYAGNNGYDALTGNFGDWLNTNNFINIVNNSYYWDSTSYTTTKAYALLMSFGQDMFTSYDDYPIRVLVVRGSQ